MLSEKAQNKKACPKKLGDSFVLFIIYHIITKAKTQESLKDFFEKHDFLSDFHRFSQKNRLAH